MREPKFRKGELGDKADKGPEEREGSLSTSWQFAEDLAALFGQPVYWGLC